MTAPIKSLIRTSVIGLVLVLAALSPARAEVSAIVDFGEAPGIYAGSIIDDGDPFGIWRSFGSHTGRVVLNAGGHANGDGAPDVIRHSTTRTPIVAWARNSPAGYDIVASRFVDGAWTTPVVVAGSPADELDPVIIENRLDGAVHVIYWIADGSPRVVRREAPADLSSWSPEVPISLPGEIALRPSVVYHEGLMRIGYEAHDNGLGTVPRQIVIATDNGQSLQYDSIATTSFAEPNWPKVHAGGGRLWIDWIDAAGTMSWIRQPTGGSWDGLEVEPFTDVEDRDYHVRGAIRLQATD